jgi:hypothetical protein
VRLTEIETRLTVIESALEEIGFPAEKMNEIYRKKNSLKRSKEIIQEQTRVLEEKDNFAAFAKKSYEIFEDVFRPKILDEIFQWKDCIKDPFLEKNPRLFLRFYAPSYPPCLRRLR